MSDEDREQLRVALGFLRRQAQNLARQGEHTRARRVRRAQIALMRDWRPGMDIDGRLAALRDMWRVEL